MVIDSVVLVVLPVCVLHRSWVLVVKFSAPETSIVALAMDQAGPFPW